MSARKYEHVHKYYKVRNSTTYRCSVKGCSHTITGGYPFLVGRKAQCPYCEKIYVIEYPITRLATLHCGRCTKNGKPIDDGTILEDVINLPNKDTLGDDAFNDLLKEKNIE